MRYDPRKLLGAKHPVDWLDLIHLNNNNNNQVSVAGRFLNREASVLALEDVNPAASLEIKFSYSVAQGTVPTVSSQGIDAITFVSISPHPDATIPPPSDRYLLPEQMEEPRLIDHNDLFVLDFGNSAHIIYYSLIIAYSPILLQRHRWKRCVLETLLKTNSA